MPERANQEVYRVQVRISIALPAGCPSRMWSTRWDFGEDTCHGRMGRRHDGPTNAAEDRRPGAARGRAGGVRSALHTHGPAPVAPGAGARGPGPHHPHDRGPPSPSPGGLSAARRAAGRDHRDPQLWARRSGDVALLGHGGDGCGDGPGARKPPGRGDRLRGRGAHSRSPAAATRLRRDHLHDGRSPQHDLEHVVRGVHPHLGSHRR